MSQPFLRRLARRATALAMCTLSALLATGVFASALLRPDVAHAEPPLRETVRTRLPKRDARQASLPHVESMAPRGIDARTLLERQLKEGAVVLLGDTHQSPQILRFLSDAVPAMTRSGAMTHLALEIGADQQEAVDHFLTTGKGLEDIRVLPAIDHPDYRSFLQTLRSARKGRGAKLKVLAIDAPSGGNLQEGRDVFMARQLADVLTRQPGARILVLVGNIHAIKGNTWASGSPALFIPDQLRAVRPGTRTFSIHQCVQTDEPDDLRAVLGPLHNARKAERPRAYLSSQPALRDLRDDTLSVLNLAPGSGLVDEVDAVIFFPTPEP